MIEVVVIERLRAITAVTTLVAQRVYQLRAQQGAARPFVRVQEIDEDAPQHLRGPVGLQTTRVQVDAYADTYDTASALAAAIHGDGKGSNASGLYGFIGDLGGSPATVSIRNARRVLKRTGYEGDEVKLVRFQQDYMIDWKDLT